MIRPLIDPAAAVAVLLAAAPGTYAVLLGSGVSSPAVPTGSELRRRTLELVYQAEEAELPDSHVRLDAWWEERSQEHATYSSMLACAFPTQEERRRYLAGFFEGKEPTSAHRALARLAKRGIVKVFLTTNFDRLMEKALDEQGLAVISVAVGEHLRAAAPREHAAAFVLKLHGDYGTQRLRNTAAELESLDPEIQGELDLVLQRYGLVVVGYSGDDPAVRASILRRGTRYGIYWVVRDEPTASQSELVNQLDGQVIRAADAATFFEDLERRIMALANQPEGRLPAQEYRESLDLLIGGNAVTVEGRRRRLARRLQNSVQEWLRNASSGQYDFPNGISESRRYESWKPYWGSVLTAAQPALDAFTACATAAIECDSAITDRFASDLVSVFNEGGPHRAGSTWIGNTPRLVSVLGAHVLLARALALGRWPAFVALARPILPAPQGTGPWIVHPEFTRPDSLGGDPATAGEWLQALVPQDQLWVELGLEPSDAEAALADANLLLSIVELAWSGRSEMPWPVLCWGLIRRPEPTVLRTLAEKAEAVELLAQLAGEDSLALRASFAERISRLLTMLSQRYSYGHWHISQTAAEYVKTIATG